MSDKIQGTEAEHGFLRLTPELLDGVIVSEFFFTATDGVLGASEMGTKPAGRAARLDTLTFCVLVLRNGFVVTGESIPHSPQNFDPELGRRLARENACEKIWALESYRIRSELAAEAVEKPSVSEILTS